MTKENYVVLARKYRPQKFADLKGHESVVKVFENSFNSGRISHAYLFTGTRGIGKTTSARIVAKGLNCTGISGEIEKPTIEVCNTCSHCTSINEDRHPDVIEMDAASRTSIEDIKEIIEFSRYTPILGRYKVIIIDEVHMISTKAFNALLKTLEEPPSRVIFIFATTEVQKIPVTILSRCQKFELGKLSVSQLSEHYSSICDIENVKYSKDAIDLISSAASGSVRDGLSLLDLAISYSLSEHNLPNVNTDIVAKLIGKNSNSEVISIVDCILKGDHHMAIASVRNIISKGTDPIRLLENIMEITYIIMMLQTSNLLDNMVYLNENESQQIKKIANDASIPVISRLWSMLLKGQEELKITSKSYMALEIIIIRICHIKIYPTPIDLISQSNNTTTITTNNSVQQALDKPPSNYDELVAFTRKHGKISLYTILYYNLTPINFQGNNINLFLKIDDAEFTPRSISRELSLFLEEKTGQKFLIHIETNNSNSIQNNSFTLDEIANTKSNEIIEMVRNNDNVKRILSKFHGSKIISIKDLSGKEIIN